MKKHLFLFAFIFIGLSISNRLSAQAYAPSVQASNVQISYKYSSGMAATITWTRGNGNYCLVELKKRNSVYYGPPSSTTLNYSANASYAGGSSLGGGDNYVVYKGTSTSVFIYNLAPNNIYDAYVHEYNDNTVFSTTTYYFNTSTAGYVGFNTLEAPASSCGSITSASSITNSAATINFSAGGGSGRFIMIAPANLTANAPTNGYYYATSTVYGSGASLGAAYGVYNNSGTSVAVTNLAGATTYKAYDYEYTNGTYPTYSTYNYNTKNYTSCNSYTFNTTNIPPTISSVPSATICQNTFLQTANLTGIGDGSANENQNLTVTATSNNGVLFPNGSISVNYSSPNPNGFVNMYPANGQYGTAVITVTVNDGWTVNNTTTTTFTVTVLPIPGSAGAISGTTPICAGLTNQSYSIAATTNTTAYTWLMPSTFTIASGAGTNNITVSTTTASTTGTMTVFATNANGCGNGIASTKSIQVDAQPADPNAGPDQPIVCGTNAALSATAVTNPDAGVWSWLSGTPVPSIGTTTVNSTSISGLTGPNNTYKYIWTVTRAGSVCPSKTDTVSIITDWNNVTCQPASAFAYSPSSDVAPSKVCVSTPINFSDLSISANSWQWDFNYNGVPNFTSVLQNPVYTYTTVGTYSVYLRIWSNATSQFYNSTQVINVIGAPATPGTVFGTNSGICQGSSSQYVYSTGTVTNATGYNWSTPTGINIDAYPSPTSIATSFYSNATSGNISVSASNSCGTSGVSTLSVTVNPLPNSAGNAIAGPTTVCQAQNNVSYNITGYTNAASYTWTDLNGSQSTGISTHTMNIGANAVSGRIYVWGNNACGAGDTVAFNITVNPLPGSAGGTSGANSSIGLCPNPGNIMYTTSTIANATAYNWGLPVGASIAGGNGADTILVNYSSTTVGGMHYITVHGSNGCGNGTADSTSIIVNTPGAPQICMVTVDDSSTHNIIYWDKTAIAYADSFRIYREDVTNIYHQIGTVHYNSLSEFHDYDPVADPNVTTKRYKISSIDSCGNESALSPYHNTIYITGNGSGQFNWIDLYTIENGANPVNNYVLMVDSTNTGNWYQRASTAGTQHVINDIYYNNYSTVANWYVETVWNISCTSTSRQIEGTQGAVIKSKSNISNNRQIGIKNNSIGSLTMYPNPTTGNLTLNLEGAGGRVTIKVTGVLGNEVYNQTITNVNRNYDIDLSANESGTYIVQIITNKGVSTQRIIKQ